MSKKTFITEKIHVSQYINTDTWDESDTLIIAMGRFVPYIPKVMEKVERAPLVSTKKPKRVLEADARYFHNPTNGYTHMLPFAARFDQLEVSLLEAGYVRCKKNEYLIAKEKEKKG